MVAETISYLSFYLTKCLELYSIHLISCAQHILQRLQIGGKRKGRRKRTRGLQTVQTFLRDSFVNVRMCVFQDDHFTWISVCGHYKGLFQELKNGQQCKQTSPLEGQVLEKRVPLRRYCIIIVVKYLKCKINSLPTVYAMWQFPQTGVCIFHFISAQVLYTATGFLLRCQIWTHRRLTVSIKAQ